MQSKSKKNELSKDRAARLLGLSRIEMGKSAARQQFFPLLRQLNSKRLAVEIGDPEQGSVIMISKSHFDVLINKLWELSKPDSAGVVDLMGCMTILGDLEEGSKSATRLMNESIKRSAENL